MSVCNCILKFSSDYGFLICIVQIIRGIEEEREEDWLWQLNLTNGRRYIYQGD
ncbi:hypothetical protein SLEP1_g4969 [Rubroshorea leprosula]|uniref:Uncharacterized protein n=1 Tax=Rubroshorea leprosula TaxID=152421 RepID=A0AAV5HQG7_9ROSI|nr:hypothetical protein SLEP1_g4969 [Rubroshorea leprosula]